MVLYHLTQAFPIVISVVTEECTWVVYPVTPVLSILLSEVIFVTLNKELYAAMLVIHSVQKHLTESEVVKSLIVEVTLPGSSSSSDD